MDGTERVEYPKRVFEWLTRRLNSQFNCLTKNRCLDNKDSISLAETTVIASLGAITDEDERKKLMDNYDKESYVNQANAYFEQNGYPFSLKMEKDGKNYLLATIKKTS